MKEEPERVTRGTVTPGGPNMELSAAPGAGEGLAWAAGSDPGHNYGPSGETIACEVSQSSQDVDASQELNR